MLILTSCLLQRVPRTRRLKKLPTRSQTKKSEHTDRLRPRFDHRIRTSNFRSKLCRRQAAPYRGRATRRTDLPEPRQGGLWVFHHGINLRVDGGSVANSLRLATELRERVYPTSGVGSKRQSDAEAVSLRMLPDPMIPIFIVSSFSVFPRTSHTAGRSFLGHRPDSVAHTCLIEQGPTETKQSGSHDGLSNQDTTESRFPLTRMLQCRIGVLHRKGLDHRLDAMKRGEGEHFRRFIKRPRLTSH